jgi:hypothetical protein
VLKVFYKFEIYRSRRTVCLGLNIHQCCGSGSGIRWLFDPWIRDG